MKDEPFVYERLSLFDDSLYGQKTGVASYNFTVNIAIMPISDRGFDTANISFDYVSEYLVDIYYNDVYFASASFNL